MSLFRGIFLCSFLFGEQEMASCGTLKIAMVLPKVDHLSDLAKSGSIFIMCFRVAVVLHLFHLIFDLVRNIFFCSVLLHFLFIEIRKRIINFYMFAVCILYAGTVANLNFSI